jgi:uncharacterized protein involved in exopolysaccharide biosynthesis
MNQDKPTESINQTSDVEEDEINLLEYLLVIVKHKKMIFRACVVTFVLSCGITLLMPNIYTSTARILPPRESNRLNSMLGDMGGLAALAGISTGSSSGDLYVGMLKSRTVSDTIIDQFDLMTVYDQEYRANMYKKLNKIVGISLGKKDGIIAVSVEDEDPERAARIANAYVNELQKLNVKINLDSAGRERSFLQARLAKVKTDLSDAEDRLKSFQEKNKAISLSDQSKMIIEAIATLRGNLAIKEVELGILLSSQTEQSPQVKILREGVEQLKEQISRLERTPEGKSVSADDIFLPTSAVPELGVQYARLLRDLKVQEKLYELLTQQYELAKITEAKNVSNIQVLDHGVVADKKSKPKRSLIVLLSTFVVGFFAVIYAFIREYGEKMPEEDREMWQEVKRNMKLRKTAEK